MFPRPLGRSPFKKKRGALQLLALSHMEINAEGHHQHVGGSVICRMMEQNS
jgi:hypothetical protein